LALERRVAFITNSVLLERPVGLFSPLASVRREILLPARALSERRVNTHVISLPSWPADSVREILEKSHRVVFGKLLVNTSETSDTAYGSDAQAYRSFLQPGRSVSALRTITSTHRTSPPSIAR